MMPAPLCSFCTGTAEFFGFAGDSSLCWSCANKVFQSFRRNKRFREAAEHGVRAVDPDKLFRPMVLPSTPSLPSRFYCGDGGDPA